MKERRSTKQFAREPNVNDKNPRLGFKLHTEILELVDKGKQNGNTIFYCDKRIVFPIKKKLYIYFLFSQ